MHKFHSRPDLVAPIITTELRHKDLLSPGYIFLAPYQAEQEGPYIYDNDGNLVWSGFGAAGPGSVHMPYVCNYLETPHLCYFEGVQMLGYGSGHGIIMDRSYRIVRSVESAGYQAATDEHEFRVLPDGKTALVTIYERQQWDLSDYGIKNGYGFIQQGVFQEIEIETGRALFEWKSLDHIPPSESFVLPGTTEISGDGYSRKSPWDYFHINSIDKDAAGDYLISGRHVSAIYKVSGKDGSIIWRMGGILSSFHQDFHFSSQHDARFVSKNATHEVISLFDNASNGFNYTKDFSEGLIISIDLAAKQAKCVQAFHAPDPSGGLMSKSQGNTQLLPNGNAVLGWGNNAYFTEFTGNGTAVWHAWIARTGTMVYRIGKYNWTGTPHTVPALYTHSKSKTDMAFYVSWNGATEVKKWRFFTGQSSDGPFDAADKIVEKIGFETVYKHPAFALWSYAEALDGEGKVLSKSRPTKTFVPGAVILGHCDDYSCTDAISPKEEEERARRKKEEEDRLKQEEERKKAEEQERQRKATVRKVFIILLDIFIGVILLILAAFVCGGKGVRRKMIATVQDVGRHASRVKDEVVRKHRIWKGDYRSLDNRGLGSSSMSSL